MRTDRPAARRAAVEHVATFRVRYPEVDRMNVAHHMHYLAWFETGRTELMRAAGVAYRAVEDEMEFFFPVVEAGARYHRSAHYDEVLEVRTFVGALAGATARFEYTIVRPETGAALAEGFTVHASVGRDGRPRRLPAPLREALTRWAAP